VSAGISCPSEPPCRFRLRLFSVGRIANIDQDSKTDDGEEGRHKRRKKEERGRKKSEEKLSDINLKIKGDSFLLFTTRNLREI
jgi:hypothetical protein